MKSYDPKNVSMIIGSHIVTEFEDGTFINVERNNDTWAIKKGASGETARAKSNDRSGIFTFTLMQTSPSNDFLSALAITDEASNSGVVPVLIKENGGTTACQATEAWIRRPSAVEYSKTVGARSWILETGDLVMNVGGLANT
jgi:hypothetical protein